MWSNTETGQSSNGRYTVVVSRAQQAGHEPWVYTWHDAETNRSFRGVIAGIQSHAHLDVLVPDDGQRFVITDLSADHRSRDRILIYEPSGKLIRSVGIGDILLFHERTDVWHSMSHTSWTGYDHDRKASTWLSDDGSELNLMTKADGPALISLRDGRVTRKPWTLQLLRHTPWFWLMAAIALLMACMFCTHRDSPLRLSLGLSSVVVGLLGLLVSLVWLSKFGYIYVVNDWGFLRSAIFAVGSLLLVWIFLGRTGWAANSITVGIGLIAISLAVALTYRDHLEPLTRTALGASAGLFVMLGAIACNGYRLRKTSTSTSGEAQLASEPARQYRILHVLICIGFAAVCMSVVRLHVFRQISSHRELHRILDGILIACLAAAITWTTLTGRRWPVLRCGLIIAVIAAALTFAPNSYRWRGFDRGYWRSMACFVGYLFCLLLVVRIHGYRLTLGKQDPEAARVTSG